MLTATIATAEVFGLVAATASIVLAAVAITQAAVFFRWSDKASKETTQASRDIAASVSKLEKLFDTFYRDTFSLVKDQFTDYREGSRSGPSREEIEKTAEENLDRLKLEMKEEIARITARDSGKEKSAETIQAELQGLIDRTIDRSRNVDIEAQVVALKPIVVKRVEEMEARGKSEMTWSDFAEPFKSGHGVRRALWSAFKELAAAGEIEYTMEPEPGPNQKTPGADKIVRFNFS